MIIAQQFKDTETLLDGPQIDRPKTLFLFTTLSLSIAIA